MTTDWFRVDCDIVDSPKVGRVADACGVAIPTALGHVLAVLAKVRQHRAHGGALGDVPDSMLEQWALWTGKRGRFATAFRDAFCDADGTLSGWAERQEPLIRRLERDRERARERRNKAGESGGESADTSPDSPRTVPVQQEQVQEQRTSPASTSPNESAAETADDAVRPRLPADYRPDLDALLAALAPTQRASWLRHMAAHLDDAQGAAVTPVVLGEAIRAFAANGADLKLALFAGYVRRAADPPPRTGTALVRANGHTNPNGRAERAGAEARARALRGAQAVTAIAGSIPGRIPDDL
jgi:hypothetical protein